MQTKRKLSLTLKILCLIVAVISVSAPKKASAQSVAPDELYRQMVNNPALKTQTGENFCWQAAYGMQRFVNNYELTKNTEWLDAGVMYYDFLIGKMQTDPDGYKGWIGKYQYDSRYLQDALVGDAILMAGILDFCVLVLEDNTLKAKYENKANAYIKTAQKDFIEKWDFRKCWVDDAPYGTYIGFNKYLKEDNLKEWIVDPKVSRSGVSHPFNKQMHVAEVCLQLHRITGEPFYWKRAEQIYFTAKSHFQYFDNHYCWNYYEPLYPGDIDLENRNTRHGVWVHPWRSGYQAGEVSQIVNAYHHGIVFDSVDIQRIINTNLEVMWNKDRVHPKYINSNGLGADGDTTGLADFKRTYGHSNAVKNGGELWTALLDFDQTIRDLYELRFKGDTTSPEYLSYKKTVLVHPPGFKRKYADDKVTVPVIEFTACSDLYLATVLPHKIPKGGESVIICKSRNAGAVSIDLYKTTGVKVANLYQGNIERDENLMITWDGKDPAKKASFEGAYKIRWTTQGGYREFPVVIAN